MKKESKLAHMLELTLLTTGHKVEQSSTGIRIKACPNLKRSLLQTNKVKSKSKILKRFNQM